MIRETITYKGECQIRKIYLFGILIYKSSKEYLCEPLGFNKYQLPPTSKPL